MSLVFAQYPLLWVLLTLSAVLSFLAPRVKRGGLALTLLAGLSTVAMVVSALACFVPYTEILTLLLLPLLLCALSMGRGERP